MVVVWVGRRPLMAEGAGGGGGVGGPCCFPQRCGQRRPGGARMDRPAPRPPIPAGRVLGRHASPTGGRPYSIGMVQLARVGGACSWAAPVDATCNPTGSCVQSGRMPESLPLQIAVGERSASAPAPPQRQRECCQSSLTDVVSREGKQGQRQWRRAVCSPLCGLVRLVCGAADRVRAVQSVPVQDDGRL